MFPNTIALESITRQYQQDRRAEAKQYRLQHLVQTLRKAARR